jgi:hypothetical protein
MPFAPMSKTQRFQISRLAAFYGIRTKNVGSGKRCYAELVKTAKTRLFSLEDVTTFMEEIFYDVKTEEANESPKKASPSKSGRPNGIAFIMIIRLIFKAKTLENRQIKRKKTSTENIVQRINLETTSQVQMQRKDLW